MSLDPRTLEGLSAYLDEKLAPAERASVEALLARDAAAREALRDLKAVRAAMKDLPPLAPPEAFYRRVWRDIDAPPARRSFFSYFPMKTVAALAVMGLVVVATHDFWNPRALRQERMGAPSPIQMLQQPVEARQKLKGADEELSAGSGESSLEYDRAGAPPAALQLDRLSTDKQRNVQEGARFYARKIGAEEKAKNSVSREKGTARSYSLKEPGALGGIRGSNAGASIPMESGAAVNEAAAPAPPALFAKKSVAAADRRDEPDAAPMAEPAAKDMEKSMSAAADSPVKEHEAPASPFLAEGQGAQSGVTRFETDVVRTAADWEALWARHAPGTPLPTLDFSQVTVLAVFAGEKTTAGGGIRILDVAPMKRRPNEMLLAGRRATRGMNVIYHVAAPPPGGFAAQVMTAPYHWVAVRRADGPVVFIPQ